MDDTIKNILNVVVVIFVILRLLSVFGLMPSMSGMRIGWPIGERRFRDWRVNTMNAVKIAAIAMIGAGGLGSGVWRVQLFESVAAGQGGSDRVDGEWPAVGRNSGVGGHGRNRGWRAAAGRASEGLGAADL